MGEGVRNEVKMNLASIKAWTTIKDIFDVAWTNFSRESPTQRVKCYFDKYLPTYSLKMFVTRLVCSVSFYRVIKWFKLLVGSMYLVDLRTPLPPDSLGNKMTQVIDHTVTAVPSSLSPAEVTHADNIYQHSRSPHNNLHCDCLIII